jgi:radical SAM superfamily enzyme YgiQ (UPF0313 family)
MKLLLTTPYLDKIVEPLYDSPNFVRTSLATLAGFVRANSDVSIKCIDAKFDQLNLKALMVEIDEFKPDIIGISAFTYEFEEAAILAKEIKARYSDQCLIVVGGSHVSALPVETLIRYSSFDLCSIGESEITLLEIIRNFKERNWVSIDGIAFKNIHGEIIQTKPRAKIDDLNSIPMPAWDMLPKATDYFIQSSRGCPFNCYFCFNPNGTKVRLRSATDIITEVNWIIEHIHPKRISFGDEAFGTNKAESLNLIHLMIENNISEKTSWDIQTHVSFIDEVLIGKLKLAGVSKIEMGVETGSEAIMKSIGKGITKEKVLTAFNLCKKYKINTGAFFIFGHPEDTKKTIWETIRFAAKINPTEPIFGILVPFPGTRIPSNLDYKIEKWSNYRKQINKTISISKTNNNHLKTILPFAILYIYLVNLRLTGLMCFLYSNMKSLFYYIKYFFVFF